MSRGSAATYEVKDASTFDHSLLLIARRFYLVAQEENAYGKP